MWSKISLLKALRRTCELLAQSEDSIWSPHTPEEVRSRLLGVIADIEVGRTIDEAALSLEFAPTSTVQEIAMTNGWHDEYMTIANVVDRF